MSQEDLGYVQADKYRRGVLKLLFTNDSMTPSELRNALSTRDHPYLGQITRALGQVGKRGLVECTTPRLRKGRLYRITEKGRKISNLIKEREVSRNGSHGRD